MHELVQDQRARWLRAVRVKLTVVLSSVIVVAFFFYALAGKGFPESFWVTCGGVGAVLFVAWWWRVGR